MAGRHALCPAAPPGRAPSRRLRAARRWRAALPGPICWAGSTRWRPISTRRACRRGERVSVWLPNRVETVVVTLACSRNGYIVQPVAPSQHTRWPRWSRSSRASARPRSSPSRAMAPTLSRSDIFAAATSVQSLRRVFRVEPGRAAAPPRRSIAAARARRQSRHACLSRLHLGHDRPAQGRAAFRQHAARQRPRHGRRLAP